MSVHQQFGWSNGENRKTQKQSGDVLYPFALGKKILNHDSVGIKCQGSFFFVTFLCFWLVVIETRLGYVLDYDFFSADFVHIPKISLLIFL